MKVCERCGVEIEGGDGDNFCRACDDGEGKRLSRAKARARRAEYAALMRSCGLVKVRGALGGTYWE